MSLVRFQNEDSNNRNMHIPPIESCRQSIGQLWNNLEYFLIQQHQLHQDKHCAQLKANN